MGFMQLGNAMPHIKAGKLVPIAVTSAKRTRFLPDVPTFAELGYDDFTAMVWFGLLTKKGTPEPIVKAYIAAAEKAHSDPEVQSEVREPGHGSHRRSPGPTSSPPTSRPRSSAGGRSSTRPASRRIELFQPRVPGAAT